MRAAQLLAVLVAFLGAADAQVVNGSFVDGLRQWAPQYDQTGAPTAVIDHTVFHGADMAALCLKAETGQRALWFQGSIPRDPRCARYRLQGWVRCRALGPDWIIRVALVACQGERVIQWLQNSHLQHAADLDWQSFALDAEVPAAATHLGVYLGLWYADALANEPPAGGGAVWYDEVTVEPLPTAAAAAPAASAARAAELTGLWPAGEQGLFGPGQPVQLVVLGTNRAAAAAHAELAVTVTDFGGRELGRQSFALTLPPQQPFRQTIELAAPPGTGAFRVSSTVTIDGQQATGPSTSYCVIRSSPRRDPYFVCDVNGAETELVRAMRRIGVSGRKIGATLSNVPQARAKDMEGWWRELLTAGLKPYWDSDLQLIGNLYLGHEFLGTRYRAAIEERRRQGLFPYPEECFQEFGDFVAGAAKALKGRVHYWVLSEEIDGTLTVPDLPGGSQAAELLRYVLMSRIAYRRLKQVDPDCEVIGLAVSGDFNQQPRWPIVRRLLPDLKDFTDIIGPDLYTDSWNWIATVSRGPEAGEMRGKLLDVLAMQRSLGKPPVTTISERGYGLAYHLAPDHPLDRLQAELTARSLILGKSVPGVLFYTLHMMCGGGGWRIRRGEVSSDRHPLIDLGLWQQGWDASAKRYTYRPRSAVAAYATVSDQLAGSTECTEVQPQTGVYTYTFKCPDRAVSALWTTEAQPVAMLVELPAAARLTDLMGNQRELPAGRVMVSLSGAPQFLSAPVPAEALATALRRAGLPGRSPVKGAARLLDLDHLAVELFNQSAQPAVANVELLQLEGAEPTQRALHTTVPANGRQQQVVALKQVAPARLGALQAQLRAGDVSVPLNADLSVTPVAPAPAGARIDGDLAEWQSRPPLVLDRRSLLPGPEVVSKGLWTGPDDLSAHVWLAWDAARFYLAARVRDDVHLQRHTGERIWMDDCVQFAFDPLNNALSPSVTGHTGYDGDDSNYGLALTSAGPQSWCWVARGGSDNAGPRDFPLAIQRRPGATDYELAIPWEHLRPLVPAVGKVLRFSLVVFDVDREDQPQAPCWLGLTGGIANGQDPSQYRAFYLAR